ncbi:TPA: hypothetical protein UZ441_003446 [Escherichia coli]|nr:hypothetical protein [Escherichia coli]HEL8043418.1 hypothetical protein [Escherichia coli]HEL8049054.1 hypothetical protein [Escherichia coli]HEL8053958.1 hypothetical protein [Escherichia coli]HEL8058540.1 hypothetical protein [Escherichia coli]
MEWQTVFWYTFVRIQFLPDEQKPDDVDDGKYVLSGRDFSRQFLKLQDLYSPESIFINNKNTVNRTFDSEEGQLR